MNSGSEKLDGLKKRTFMIMQGFMCDATVATDFSTIIGGSTYSSGGEAYTLKGSLKCNFVYFFLVMLFLFIFAF